MFYAFRVSLDNMRRNAEYRHEHEEAHQTLTIYHVFCVFEDRAMQLLPSYFRLSLLLASRCMSISVSPLHEGNAVFFSGPVCNTAL